MLGFLKKFMPPKYRIFHDPDLGYLPLEYDFIVDTYLVIERNLTTGVPERSATKFPEDWHRTEESAGNLINKYQSRNSGKDVWQSN